DLYSLLSFFFIHTTSPCDLYTLSLHDALPISRTCRAAGRTRARASGPARSWRARRAYSPARRRRPQRRSSSLPWPRDSPRGASRSEEHTSELQSHLNLVCRLLLEKKKKTYQLK